jgi:bifunctional DNA-binding transcriptional regulator/antitoxin component of YhaV-PrlF toxin-antitoxin module
MRAPQNAIIEDGKVVLPGDVRDRYGLADHTPIRIIETKNGLFLVPLTNEPISETLSAELAEWQSLGSETWEMFPYDEAEGP